MKVDCFMNDEDMFHYKLSLILRSMGHLLGFVANKLIKYASYNHIDKINYLFTLISKYF